MHYGDFEQIENAILEVVLYLEPDDIVSRWKHSISSIRKCQFISPHELIDFNYTFRYNFKSIIDTCKEEGYYIFTFGSDGYDLIYKSHQFVTDEMAAKDPLLVLH